MTSATKTPQLPNHHLERPMLTSRLNESNARLISLIAPAGYGKSVTLNHHALTSNRICLWGIKPKRDLPGLIRETLLGLDRLAHNQLGPNQLGLNQLGLNLQFPTDPHPSPEDLATCLNACETGLDLIFDPIDNLDPNAIQWLADLASELNDGHRVITASREECGLPISRLAAQGLCNVIAANDLAFAAGETATYLRQAGLEHQADLATTLEGWPLAAAMAANQVQNASMAASFKPDELLTEYIDRLPFDVRSSLSDATVLETWSDQAASDAGLDMPIGWLREVKRAGLPITPVQHGAGQHGSGQHGSGQHSFQPHASLRRYLEDGLKLKPERHRLLHAQATTRAEESGSWRAAVRHALAAGLNEKALELAQRSIDVLRLAADTRGMREVLEQLKLEDLPDHLQGEFGIALIYGGDPVRGEQLLRHLRQQGRALQEALFGLCLIAFGKLDVAGQNIFLSEAEGVPMNDFWRARFHRYRARQLIEANRNQEGFDLSLQLYEDAKDRGDVFSQVNSLMSVHGSAMALGEFTTAEHYGKLGLNLARSIKLVPLELVILTNLADTCKDQYRLEEGFEHINAAIELAERNRATLLPLMYLQQAFLHLQHVDFPAAITSCLRCQQHLVNQVFDGAGIQTRQLLSYAYRRTNQHHLIPVLLEQNKLNPPPAGTIFHGGHHLALAIDAFWKAELGTALEHLSIVAPPNCIREEHQRALAFSAECHRRQGTLERTHVQALIAALDDYKHDHVLKIDALILGRLYAECVERDWYPERFAPYAGTPNPANFGMTLDAPRSTDTSTNTSANAPANLADLPTPSQPKSRPAASSGGAEQSIEFAFQALGQTEISINGSETHLALAKAAELIAYLIIHGPSNRETLITNLFDGSNDPKHIPYFKTIIRRQRQAFFEHPSVTFDALEFEHKLYRLHPNLRIDFDANRIETALKSNDLEALERAVLAYGGNFLPLSNSEWVEHQRQHYTATASAAALSLAQQTLEPTRSLALHRKAINIDRYHAPSHTALIRALLKHQQIAQAQAAYREYERMLASEYGDTPDPNLTGAMREAL